MQVAEPLGHADTIRRLWAAARGGRLPHALLFEGRAGIGKYQAAKWLAMGCLCAQGPGVPCGTCGPCRRVASGGERGNHPDLFVLDHEDPGLADDFKNSLQIKVGRIAYRPGDRLEQPEYCVERFLDLRRAEGAFRPLLVREAQRMNPQAQNALLKTLEEPRSGTVMVLETHKTAALLPTIKSRCIRIRFEALTRTQCEEVLARAGIEAEAARELARLAEGSPGLALAMARNGTRSLRERLVAVASGARAGLEVAAELGELEGEFAGKSTTAIERERCRVVLELAQALVRDALRLRAGVAEQDLPHGDVARVVAERTGERGLARAAEVLAVARADVEHNLAPGALLERALLVLGEGVAGPH